MVAALSVNSDGSDTTWSDPTDPEPVSGKACGFEQIAENVVQRFDSNGDGSLSADEQAQLHSEFGDDDEGSGEPNEHANADAGAARQDGGIHGRAAMLIQLYDTNGDGTLDATEIAALKADIEARCQARLAKLVAEFDTNGDGTLDDSEWQAAQAALHARFEQNREQHAKDIDKDGDGEISATERKDAKEAADKAREAAEQQFDEDGDGQLQASEQEGFREHARESMRDDVPMTSGDVTTTESGSGDVHAGLPPVSGDATHESGSGGTDTESSGDDTGSTSND